MTDPLLALANRVRHEPRFLASLLETFAVSCGLDETSLAVALGCAVGDLLLLRLCRTPRTTTEGFREDVELISRRFHLDPLRLGAILKRARVVARLRDAAGPLQDSGFVMAARDRPAAPTEETAS